MIHEWVPLYFCSPGQTGIAKLTVEDAREAAGCVPARPRALSLDAFASGVIIPLNPHEDLDGLGSPIASATERTEPAAGTARFLELVLFVLIFRRYIDMS